MMLHDQIVLTNRFSEEEIFMNKLRRVINKTIIGLAAQGLTA